MNKVSSSESDNRPYTFYPAHMFVEGVAALLVLLVLGALALVWQVPLEEIADPGDSSYVPRPEWYFLFYFQLLKYFEGALFVVGTFILPVVICVLLFLWPFLDRGEETRILKRPKSVALGLGAVLLVGVLTVLALVEDSDLRMDLPLIQEEHIAEGADLFGRFCVLCHSMDGKGGFMAPDLTEVGSRVNRVYIERVILTPQIVSQTTIMSKIPLSDDERHSISAYLSRKK